jgi:hypothetical protein
MTSHSKQVIFDIEADGLTPTKIWCIVAKDLNESSPRTFGPDQLKEGIEYFFL